MVEFLEVTCTSSPNEYGEWNIEDDLGTALVDNKLFNFDPIVSQLYSITGIGDFGFVMAV